MMHLMLIAALVVSVAVLAAAAHCVGFGRAPRTMSEQMRDLLFPPKP